MPLCVSLCARVSLYLIHTHTNLPLTHPLTALYYPRYSRPGFEGDLPAARAEHAATGLDGSVYVFGGVSAHYGYSNDFYVFDPVAVQWGLIDRYGGQGPTRRAGHNLVRVWVAYAVYVASLPLYWSPLLLYNSSSH